MGANRELKKATEAYWAGKSSVESLIETGKTLRAAHWRLQKEAGADTIASNDFSFYDQILDHIQLFSRYTKYGLAPIDEFFAMGRGLQRPATETSSAVDVPSLEMVKWFDSNYHYVKPTLADNQTFKLSSNPKPVSEFLEAKSQGITPPHLLPVYEELLVKLAEAGAETVQIDEPILTAFKTAYERLTALANGPKIIVATYFGDIVHNLDVLPSLTKASAIHIDLVRAPQQLDKVLKAIAPSRLSLLVSCRWFSFAAEKAKEVAILAKAVTSGIASSMDARKNSTRTNDPAVKERQSKITPDMYNRKSPFADRMAQQQKHLGLPLFPTTTIGSFPQTKEIRLARQKLTKGEIDTTQYEQFIKKEIELVVKEQEAIGLDVLVHGEPERNDMVQYFGERLTSYGSRCVRPPIIVGDVSRPAPMTAEQLALALRDEVQDLEAAGVNVIQEYQIHSHFCYSEFQDFFHAITALDADVMSIECSKSDAKLLKVFEDEAYPRHIGPVSTTFTLPAFPANRRSRQDRRDASVSQARALWIDPDCGLKTRQWPETKAALTNMVNAAKYYREKYAQACWYLTWRSPKSLSSTTGG
ncbi:hypothetical protein BGX38DRAFT_1248147 [Terfezia claveryi]|nr:hypothetical protein BGX38DRAFT_1248147 [Terfezia claveryi]